MRIVVVILVVVVVALAVAWGVTSSVGTSTMLNAPGGQPSTTIQGFNTGPSTSFPHQIPEDVDYVPSGGTATTQAPSVTIPHQALEF